MHFIRISLSYYIIGNVYVNWAHTEHDVSEAQFQRALRTIIRYFFSHSKPHAFESFLLQFTLTDILRYCQHLKLKSTEAKTVLIEKQIILSQHKEYSISKDSTVSTYYLNMFYRVGNNKILTKKYAGHHIQCAADVINSLLIEIDIKAYDTM